MFCTDCFNHQADCHCGAYGGPVRPGPSYDAVEPRCACPPPPTPIPDRLRIFVQREDSRRDQVRDRIHKQQLKAL